MLLLPVGRILSWVLTSMASRRNENIPMRRSFLLSIAVVLTWLHGRVVEARPFEPDPPPSGTIPSSRTAVWAEEPEHEPEPSEDPLAQLGHVEVSGNIVLPPGVYISVLRYAGWQHAPEMPNERAQWIRETLEDFLRRSGYELATVDVRYERGDYILSVDEGRLDKVVFRNTGTWEAIQLVFMVDLPGRVFNRYVVESELRNVQKRISVRSLSYEIVPVDASRRERVQVAQPRIIEDFELLTPGEDYELHIFLDRGRKRAGFDIGLGARPPDGVRIDVDYLAPSALLREDRLELYGKVGVRIRDIGRVRGNRAGISQAGLGLAWSTPAFAQLFRIVARIEGSLEARRREDDLRLENYFFAPMQLGLGFVFERKGLGFGLDGGIEQRNFFGARSTDAVPVPVLDETETSNLRAFTGAHFSWVLNPERLRKDRQHEVLVSTRVLWPLVNAEGTIQEFVADYNNVLTFGFDEFRYSLRGVLLEGQVPFYSEVAMGDGFLRSAFQGEVYARRVGAVGLEYRLSLTRDILKLSLFSDIAVYEALDDLRVAQGLESIANVGLGFHVLVMDTFQVNTYLGPGLRSDGELDFGVSLGVSLAY